MPVYFGIYNDYSVSDAGIFAFLIAREEVLFKMVLKLSRAVNSIDMERKHVYLSLKSKIPC